MEQFELAGQLRENTGKGVARKLRAAGRVPAIAYGQGTDKPISLSVPSHELVQILSAPGGRTQPIALTVGDAKYRVLVQDYQFHPISRHVLHCDFLVMDDTTPVTVDIPVKPSGRSKGEAAGATLILARREVRVKCPPDAIPLQIPVDVTPLEQGEVLYVDQLTFPENVTPVYRARYPVVVVKKAKAGLAIEGEEGEAEGGEAGAEEAETKTEE